MSDLITASIAGGSGYAGMETIRLLSGHPVVRMKSIYGNTSANNRWTDLYPAFQNISETTVKSLGEVNKDTSDVLFFALPHGKSAEPVAGLINSGFKGKIIDLGSDFRLHKTGTYKREHGKDHAYPEILTQFTYGLPEFFRDKIKNCDRVASPGCFATCIQLAVVPLGGLPGPVDFHITAVTGSSGSGANLSNAIHFSNRFGNLKAYKVLSHQHMAEINQTIQEVHGSVPNILFTPVSGPFVRGIWLTLSFTLAKEIDIGALYKKAYDGEPFVRLRSGLPNLKDVVGSNFTDIGWEQKGRNVVVGAALDNLVKGAAGQAIQNMNLMFGLDETTGLNQPGYIL